MELWNYLRFVPPAFEAELPVQPPPRRGHVHAFQRLRYRDYPTARTLDVADALHLSPNHMKGKILHALFETP